MKYILEIRIVSFLYYLNFTEKNNTNYIKKLLPIVLTGLSVLIFSEFSKAIPAFSRKYATSCITCHSVFPKLNSFGEAFRMNGYKYPGDDDDKIKEEPLLLGSEAYKNVWPKSVWPNSIPGTLPVSLRGRSAFEVVSDGHETTSEFTKPSIQLLGSGSIGEKMSTFVGAHLFENGKVGSIDRLFLKFNNIFTKLLPEYFLSFQVGQFIPEIVPFASNHRSLTNAPYAFNTYAPSNETNFAASHTHNDSTTGVFGIENFQLGVEASGIVISRLRYVIGVVNGSGTQTDVNSNRDFYGRLCYKMGGMGFDGSLKEGANAEKENSVTLGIFGYQGIDTKGMKNYDFFRAGSDINFKFSKLNIIGGYILGENKISDSLQYNLFFTEIDYMLYPWLVCLIRYEHANPKSQQSVKQLIPHISTLVVANMKFKLETRFDPDDLHFSNLYFGFDFAF